MKTVHARWFEVALALLVGLLLARPLANFFHGVGDVISDGSFFREDRAHHLNDGHIWNTKARLADLQRALLKYSQHHNGDLSPLKSAKLTRQLLRSCTDDKQCFNNLKNVPFQPNTSLANVKFNQIKNPAHVVLFYDESPAETYPQVYFVTVDGQVNNVSSNDWIRLQRLWQKQQKIGSP